MNNVNLYPRPLLVAFGNPLLDICVQTPESEDICDECGLALDGESEVQSDVARKLQERTSSYPKQIRCGGSALNTTRILQWLLGSPCSLIFSGTLGKDDNGKLVQEMTEKDGVVSKFAEHPDLPTGVVTVLVHGVHRSLVAHIGAAQVFKEEYLSKELIANIRTSQIVLIEAYFCLHNINVALKIMQECHEHGTCFVFALSSDYVFRNPSCDLLNLVKNADIVIGNEREFKALTNSIGRASSDVEQMLNSVLDWGVKEGDFVPLKLRHLQSKGKVVFCTRGKESVICAEQTSGAITKIPVPTVNKIVDATGSGDSFASGVLMGLLLQADFITCAQLGMYAASEILQKVGCAIPGHRPLTLVPKSDIGALVW